jgi:predicted porin
MQKKHLLAAALALAGVSGAQAQAQSSVTIYGLLDTAVERVTNVDAAGSSRVRMTDLSGGQAPSRLGFRGTEALGGGLNAIFTLEQGIAPDSGNLNQGGRAFGRQAFVGITGAWGSLTVGRQYTMLGGSFADADIIGPANFGLGSLDPYLPNARHDNSIVYRGTFSGFTAGASYSLGRDASAAGGPGATNCAGESATDKSACKARSFLLRYDAANWGVGAAYDSYHGGTGAAAAFGPTSSSLDDTRINIGAYAKFGPLKVGGGVMRRDNEGVTVPTATTNPKSTISYLGVAYTVTPAFVLDGEFARYDLKNSANDTNMLIVRGTYSFSKRTAVYALVGRVNNKGTAARSISSGNTVGAGMSQTGLMTGIRHTF